MATKALYTTNQPGPTLTGADRLLCQLVDRSHDSGWTTFIAAPGSSALHERYSGTEVITLKVSFTPLPGSALSTRKTISQLGPDLVHANSIYPLAFLRMIGCLDHKPVTAASVLVDPTSRHPLAAKHFKGAIAYGRTLISRIESKKADRIFTLSPVLAKKLTNLGVDGNIVISPSGIDAALLKSRRGEPFDSPSGYPIISSAVGQLEKLKGVEYLINAFAKVQEVLPRAQLMIAGKGSLESTLRNQASRLGLADHVHFVGYLTNVAPMLDRSDIYALPSLSEGINTSILEAMALRLPVVATDTGGTRDIIEDGVDGILVPVASVDPLAKAIISLGNDKKRSEELSAKAERKATEQFPKSRYSDVVFSEYSGLGLALPSAMKPTP